MIRTSTAPARRPGRRPPVRAGLGLLAALGALLALVLPAGAAAAAPAAATAGPAAPFTAAAHRTGVPASVLEGLCYLEGRLGMHGGRPSIDHGYGCMHLVDGTRGGRTDGLGRAASALHVDRATLRTDLTTNVLGGATVLAADARSLSPDHALPASVGGWYGAVAAYSGARLRGTRLMYADALYRVLNHGFSAKTAGGATLTLAPQHATPDKGTADRVRTDAASVPAGCTTDTNVDYAGAVDCVVGPASEFDCTVSSNPYPGCTYDGADRPNDYAINGVVIHDIEGTAQNGIDVFQDHNSGVSIHYVVGGDGTVYQMLREKDIAYQDGNYWSNSHTIGIEHSGFDATGYQWYNATEYLASAKLVAYLLKKYHLPLDRAHLVSHATVPSPNSNSTNHVDPGPYWLWDYYLGLIHKQGVAYPRTSSDSHVITLKPRTDAKPYGKNGTETPANFNFFYLYKGPSTDSGLIPQQGDGTDVTDATNNVEVGMSYAYVAKKKDPAGTGDTMYEVWYGESDQAHSSPKSNFLDGHLAWLAVPSGAAARGVGQEITLTGPPRTDGTNFVYGAPVSGTSRILGSAPVGAVFAAMDTVTEDGTSNQWYVISFNHRLAYVPASAATVVHGKR